MPSESCYFKESGDDRCFCHGLGGSVRGKNSELSLVSHTEREEHQFSRTTNSVTSSETFCAFSQKSSCIGQDGQYNSDSLHKSAGGSSFLQASLASKITNYVEQQNPSVVTCDTCSRNNEQGSRFTVQRESSIRGVETPPPSDPQGVAEIQLGRCRSLRIVGRHAMSPFLLSGWR